MAFCLYFGTLLQLVKVSVNRYGGIVYDAHTKYNRSCAAPSCEEVLNVEIGPILALLTAVVFATAQIFVRRGVSRTGESFTAVIISIFMGILFFSLAMLYTAEWDKIWSLSWPGLVLLAAGGISHFVIGRLLGYSSIRLIGANRGIVISRTSLFYAVALGILFLNEPVTAHLVIGVLCIFLGVILVGIEKNEGVSKIQNRGVPIGLAGAFFWGISGVLIKPAIGEIGSPVAAAFVSYVAAFPVIVVFLLRKGQRGQLTQLRWDSLIPLVIAGSLMAVTHLLRYAALSYSPVSVVTPLVATVAIFTFFFSFVLNRSLEVFTWKVFIGVMATVAGAFLFFQ